MKYHLTEEEARDASDLLRTVAALAARAKKRRAKIRPMKLVGSGRLVGRLGRVVCKRRLALGMSGPELAAAAGIGKGHLSSIENHNSNISLDTLEKLANALRLPPAHLISEAWAPNK
jgi:DNA-binding Xre family transcriptional regulator